LAANAPAVKPAYEKGATPLGVAPFSFCLYYYVHLLVPFGFTVVRGVFSRKVGMADFLRITISGLATGSIYAIAAVSFALLWQTAGAINFAHGEFVAIPAIVMLALREHLHIGIFAAFGLSLVLSAAVLGVAFKLVLVDRLLKHGEELPLVVATIGLGLLMREIVSVHWSATAQPFPSIFPDKVWTITKVATWRIGRVAISANDIGIVVVTALIIAGLQLFLSRTYTGRQMEATAQSRDTAKVLGIPVKRMIMYTFLINAILVTVASLLVTPTTFAKYDNGLSLGTMAFTGAIVGGFNQVKGALAGGFLIGVLENWSGFYVSSPYRTAGPLLLLIIVILFRPQGLFGRAEERRI
jgi:branched-chain amino acid transport system permease protein